MKTKIYFTGILLIAMTVASFGMEKPKAGLERELVTEEWMKAPFILENDLALENWMVTPFEEGLGEHNLTLENWMTEPFEILDEQEDALECWMVTPFDNSEICASR